ncbi:MAG: ZIP family metal transporter [Chitinophagaceae bacterium]
MIWLYLILLFAITLLGGVLPFIYRKLNQETITLLLAFSGAFLLGISALHLLPETVMELGEKAGIFILLGFGLQLMLQRVSHGVEHGHVHAHSDAGTLWPVLFGLCIHAFLEGLPLGFNYQNEHTLPALFLGVAAHKIPEAITLSIFLLGLPGPKRWFPVLLFALMSPLATWLAMVFGEQFFFVSNLLVYVIPIVLGGFLHISTTILYESGTKHHQLSKQKLMAVLLGFAMAFATLLLHQHHA